jgi:hypothetical protein
MNTALRMNTPSFTAVVSMPACRAAVSSAPMARKAKP